VCRHEKEKEGGRRYAITGRDRDTQFEEGMTRKDAHLAPPSKMTRGRKGKRMKRNGHCAKKRESLKENAIFRPSSWSPADGKAKQEEEGRGEEKRADSEGD